MFQNSLAGAHRLGDQPMTLRHQLTETYSTATGSVARTTTDVPFLGQPRNLSVSDRRLFGEEDAEKAVLVIAVHARQFAAGVVPDRRDQVLIGATAYNVASVRTIQSAGMLVSYLVALT